jgi:hypothetical protein
MIATHNPTLAFGLDRIVIFAASRLDQPCGRGVGLDAATVVAIGSIVIAGMTRIGYPLKFGAGVICDAGTLGILIPPSIVMVVYAAATDSSIGRLFMAGVIPGIVLGLMLADLPASPREYHQVGNGCDPPAAVGQQQAGAGEHRGLVRGCSSSKSS